MGQVTKMIVDKDFQLAKVDDRLYGAFIEHLGGPYIQEFTSLAMPVPTRKGFAKMSLN